jgi:hypothetical protein
MSRRSSGGAHKKEMDLDTSYLGSGEDDQISSGGAEEPSILTRQERHKVYHRDFNHREIGSHEDKKVETLQISKHQEDLDRPLVETRGGDRGIGVRKSTFPWTRDRVSPL